MPNQCCVFGKKQQREEVDVKSCHFLVVVVSGTPEAATWFQDTALMSV